MRIGGENRPLGNPFLEHLVELANNIHPTDAAARHRAVPFHVTLALFKRVERGDFAKHSRLVAFGDDGQRGHAGEPMRDDQIVGRVVGMIGIEQRLANRHVAHFQLL